MFIPKMIRFATVFAAAMAVAGLAYAQEPPPGPRNLEPAASPSG